MLPIGIVIPTRNNALMLRGQAASLRSVVEHAAETVVVDSSEDGTMGLLQEILHGLEVRFLKHPPGLYESWNQGIAHIGAPYTYISTAGDSITRKGLEHLVRTAESFEADVVVSPPEFRDATGKPVPEKRWPIHNLIERSSIREPVLLDPWLVFLLQVLDVPQSLMGSSAANLYKTTMLRERPFPTGYGHFGDVAWGIQHALGARLAVTPSVVSRFMLHESGGSAPIVEIERARARLLALAMQVLDEQTGMNLPPWVSDLRKLSNETSHAWTLQQAYDDLRKGALPWFLKPTGWKARKLRKQQIAKLASLKKRLLDESRRYPAHSESERSNA